MGMQVRQWDVSKEELMLMCDACSCAWEWLHWQSTCRQISGAQEELYSGLVTSSVHKAMPYLAS